MAHVSVWVWRRLEWWPEMGATLGVAAGTIRGLVGGDGSLGPPVAAAVALILAASVAAHWLTKRAYFDKRMEHFLAAQYSAFIVLLAVGQGIIKDVVERGFWSWPLFDIAYSLVVGGIVYWLVFVFERRIALRQWRKEEGSADGE